MKKEKPVYIVYQLKKGWIITEKPQELENVIVILN